MSGYRQWQLPKEANSNNTNNWNNQIERYKLIIETCKEANNENKEMIICMDDNIDTLADTNITNEIKMRELKNIRVLLLLIVP